MPQFESQFESVLTWSKPIRGTFTMDEPPRIGNRGAGTGLSKWGDVSTYVLISLVSAVSAISLVQLASSISNGRRRSVDRRDESLERFCGVLRLLPDEEWAFIEAKLDNFLGGNDEDATDDTQDQKQARLLREGTTAADNTTNTAQVEPRSSASVTTSVGIKTTSSGESQEPKCHKETASQITPPEKPSSNATNPSITNDQPELGRFRMMLKVGINPDAVKLKMVAEGLNPEDVFGADSSSTANAQQSNVISQVHLTSATTMTKVVGPELPVERPELARFKTMLKVGIDPQAVKLKMLAEGVDPDLLFSNAAPVLKSSDTAPAKAFGMELTPLEALNADSLWRRGSSIPMDGEADVIAQKIAALFKSAPSSSGVRVFKSSTSTEPSKRFSDENEPPSGFKSGSKKQKFAQGQVNGRQGPNSSVKQQSLIPARRAQNLQIGFAKFKLDPERICDAVVRMESEVFGRKDDDNLQLLLRLLPSDEELSMMRAFKGDETTLSDIERLFRLFALRAPDARSRVESMVFTVKFPVAVKDFQTQTEVIGRACATMTESSAVADLLRTVVAVGMFISGSTSVKGAISIHGLADRLVKTKTADNKCTAADIVAGYFKARYCTTETPKGGVTKLLPLIEPSFAQFPSLTVLETELRELQKGIDRRVSLNDEFSAEFVRTAQSQLDRLTSALNDLKTQYNTMLRYFGEPADRPLNIFFQDISSLIGTVQAALVTSKFSV